MSLFSLVGGHTLGGESEPNGSFPQRIVWVIGAPGSGKGTNTEIISQALGCVQPYIVISNLLKGEELRRIKDSGGLVDDKVVITLLSQVLGERHKDACVLVDGFPRSVYQARWLIDVRRQIACKTHKVPDFYFVFLNVTEATSVERQLYRGLKIHEENNRRQQMGLSLLEERQTDTSSELAKERYHLFQQESYPAFQIVQQEFPVREISADGILTDVQNLTKDELRHQSEWYRSQRRS